MLDSVQGGLKMAELTIAIPMLRDSAVAVLRIHTKRPEMIKKGKTRPAEFKLNFGSGFCILGDRYIMTAFHVLNDGQPRIANDRFYVFTVPGNGAMAYHFPVVGFPLELSNYDLALLEIGSCATGGVHIPAIPVSFSPKSDGTRVVTVGYPAPEIHSINIDSHGDYHGGQFFLKSHANEGIVSAQYSIGARYLYELNVGWHHGESGGLIASIEDRVAVFSIMQEYRNVQSPYGIVAGPHRGVTLSAIEQELLALGIAGAEGGAIQQGFQADSLRS